MKKSKLKAPVRDLAHAQLLVEESESDASTLESAPSTLPPEASDFPVESSNKTAQLEINAARAEPAPAPDDYELLEELGAGGMGSVYRAHRKGVEKTLAVKKLHAKFATDAASVSRFEQEAKAASLLTHSNLVSVYDFGMSRDGTPYLVMDYVDGISLAELICQHGHLPAARVANIFLQACEGLIHAHAKKVVHRDLKPNNIMLTQTDEELDLVKIVDFGIAKLMPQAETNAQRLTQTGDVLGSPVYMSPEQCVGGKVDERSDIYSLGCVMYEALMGQPPFLGENIVQTILQHLNDTPRSFATCRPDVDVPPALEKIVFKCLEKTQSQRYQSVAELRDDLELASGNLSPAREKFIRSRIKRAKLGAFLKRRERMVAVVAGVLITACLTTFWFLRDSNSDAMLQKLVQTAEIAAVSYSKNESPAWQAAVNEATRLRKPLQLIGVLELKLARSYEHQPGYNGVEIIKHARLAHAALSKADDAIASRLEAVKTLKGALQLNPDMTQQFHDKAAALAQNSENLIRENKFDAAIKVLREAINTEKFELQWRDKLASAYELRASSESGVKKISDLEQAVWYGGGEIGPGGWRKQNPKYEKALRAALGELRINGESASARYQLALDRLRKLDYSAAAVHAAAAENLGCKIGDRGVTSSIIEMVRVDDMDTGRGTWPHKEELLSLDREELILCKTIFGPADTHTLDHASHHLSTSLISAKKYREAENVIREELKASKPGRDLCHTTGHLLVALAGQHKWTEAQKTYDQLLQDILKRKDDTYGAFSHNTQIRTYLEMLQEAGRVTDCVGNINKLIVCFKKRGQDSGFQPQSVYVKSGLPPINMGKWVQQASE